MSAPLLPEDEELVERATQAIADREVPGWHGVGAAVRTPSGNVYEAVHLEADVGRIAVCAEAIAIGKAVYDGEFGISAIASVLASGEGHFAVVPPCGMCREMISDYGPGARVIHPDHEGMIVASPIKDLLPAKWSEATIHPKVPRP